MPDTVSPAETNNPIFELRFEGRHIKIYANGWVEGVEDPYIVNHLPTILRTLSPKWFHYYSSPQMPLALSVGNVQNAVKLLQ